MTATEFLHQILDPGLAFCSSLPGWNIPSDERARVLMIAIAGQEANWSARVQGGNGPAHSQFQMERRGMVTEVLTNPKTSDLANEVCRMTYVTPDPWSVMATEKGDKLAVALARLGLWLDPHALPAVGAEQAAFDCYVRVWRPGAVTRGGQRAIDARHRWTGNYQAAMAAVKEQCP